MAFVVFLDANVIYPAVLRDVLLSLAEGHFYQVRWSPHVLDEMQRNVAVRANAPDRQVAEAAAEYTRRVMEEAFEDALIEREAYERLIPCMTNASGDRHVLAAAILGRAQVLVTSNVKHFPPESCAVYDIEVQDPDTFLLNQLSLAPQRLLDNLAELSAMRQPPMSTAEGILSALEAVSPEFSRRARAALSGLGHSQR